MIESPKNTCMSCFTQHAAPIDPCTVCGYNESAQERTPHLLQRRTILNGKYLVGKVLGQGGFGITYIGWDLNLDLKVAIKEYYPTGCVTRETTSTGAATVQPFTGSQGDFFFQGREKFINEAKTLAKFFSLPGIVSVKDYFQENGTAYISMEYIDGETLKDYLAKMGGKLPVAQVFDMIKPVISSLAEIHKAGIIHRDISPDNIMISKEGYMKLLDFGAARDFSENGAKSMSIMLKPGFAPEEQYRSKGGQGPWTDVYALSATIYRCITGETPDESVERVHIDEVKPPSSLGITIAPAQEAALMRGMAVLQNNRFQNMSELYNALNGAAIPQTMPFPTPAVGQAKVADKGAKAWVKSHKPLAFGIILPVIVALIFGIVWLFNSLEPHPEPSGDDLLFISPSPTPDASPLPTPEPLPEAVHIPEPWFYAYRDFVVNEHYLPIIKDRPSGETSSFDGFASFLLHDLDGDGIPELLALYSGGYGGDGAGASVYHFFTFENDEVVRIGMIYDSGGFFTAPDTEFPGFFYSFYMGDYWAYYLELVRGEIVITQIIYGEAYTDMDSLYIIEQTNNDALYEAYLVSGAHPLNDFSRNEDNLLPTFSTTEEIRRMGWNEFVHLTLGISFTENDVSEVPETDEYAHIREALEGYGLEFLTDFSPNVNAKLFDYFGKTPSELGQVLGEGSKISSDGWGTDYYLFPGLQDIRFAFYENELFSMSMPIFCLFPDKNEISRENIEQLFEDYELDRHEEWNETEGRQNGIILCYGTRFSFSFIFPGDVNSRGSSSLLNIWAHP